MCKFLKCVDSFIKEAGCLVWLCPLTNRVVKYDKCALKYEDCETYRRATPKPIKAIIKELIAKLHHLDRPVKHPLRVFCNELKEKTA